MTIADIQREIAALPTLKSEDEAAAEAEDALETIPAAFLPLENVARQGRLILRLTAAVESLEKRQDELRREHQTIHALLIRLTSQLDERDAQVRTLDTALEAARSAAETDVRQTGLAAARMMDALDAAAASLARRGHLDLAGEIVRAQRDGLRHLAAAGITEIPSEGRFDGRLHEGLDVIAASVAGIPRYHIAQVVRRGFQRGTDILRRAAVVTAN